MSLTAISLFFNTKPGRIVKRVGITAVTAFAVTAGGLAVDSGVFDPAHVTDLSLWAKVLIGGETAAVGAVLSLAQSLVTQWLSGQPTVKGLRGRRG